MGKNTKMDIKKRSADSRSDEPIAKRLRKSTRMSFGIMLESFINNPGLQHIAENILQNLDKHSLLKYRLVNSSWKRILDQPIFWLNKLLKKEVLENSKWKSLIPNLVFDSDRKVLTLGIIKESIKADELKEEQVRGWENRIKILKRKIRNLKKIHKIQMQIMQNEEKIRENEEKMKKNEEKMSQNLKK